ncbi:MAG: hypothetical protein MK010_11030 [Erythrobacter sp.]|nr:hypothetical protein [Erythrobacter sp.]
MAAVETRADCTRCAALCCIAYPSDDMPGFSARKQAGEPCPKLAKNGLCTIYDRRAQEGFAGCIRYECFGAGQHVVETLFEGRDWRDDPAILKPMIESFLAMRPVSDLLFLARRLQARGGDAADIVERLEAIASSRENLIVADGLASCERDLRALYRALGPEAV